MPYAKGNPNNGRACCCRPGPRPQVFNVAPTVFEVTVVTAILTAKCGPALGVITIGTLAGERRDRPTVRARGRVLVSGTRMKLGSSRCMHQESLSFLGGMT